MRDVKGDEVKTSVDELLREAPIGSRVTWRNLEAPESSDFFNENTIKLGADRYAAHGFGTTNVFTRAELELSLARATRPEATDADRAEFEAFVFVRAIQHFLVP
jgi:hypothetical protein